MARQSHADVGETACYTQNHPGQAGWYTDFISDDTHTTASLYFFPMDASAQELANPGSFDFDQLCENLDQHQFCNQETSLHRSVERCLALDFIPEDLSQFKNPFRLGPEEALTWDGACESGVTAISDAEYSDASAGSFQKIYAMDRYVCQ